MRYIGDVHGKFGQYLAITDGCKESIQVGDFGAGFGVPLPELGIEHLFIRGNHDNPKICRESQNWIPDMTHEGDTFFLGGGFSIDREHRTEDYDWWADEELSTSELFTAVDRYEEAKPSLMISHECPADIVPALFARTHKSFFGASRTSQALGSMLYVHKPETWIFGHWHTNVDQVINGTRFICLAECAWIDL